MRRLAATYVVEPGAGIHMFGDRFTVAANVVSEMSGADGIGSSRRPDNNTGLVIEAVDGVTDGGGNRPSGQGQLGPVRWVACSTVEDNWVRLTELGFRSVRSSPSREHP